MKLVVLAECGTMTSDPKDIGLNPERAPKGFSIKKKDSKKTSLGNQLVFLSGDELATCPIWYANNIKMWAYASD